VRKEIRQILVDEISLVGGRVYEPHAAGPTIEKPYLVLREGVQDPEADWSAFSTIVEVWPYVSRTTFQQVDALANQVIDALHRTRFADAKEQYLIDYIGSAGQDFVDTEWDAITRGLRFRVFALGWLNGLTYDPDPVAALQGWTTAKWPEAHTDPATWSPADATPGFYWRLVRLVPAQVTVAVAWLDAEIAGHVLAPSATVRLQWVRRITEGLARKRRIRLSDGSPLFLNRVTADSEADPMRKGQIQLIARFGVLQPEPAIPVLRRGVISGDARGEVK
jgi:hypothetical protein